MKQLVEYIISINVYKCVETLKLQLQNIKKHVHEPYAVILNCDESFFKALQGVRLEGNVRLNPERITKRRLHGSLMKGIVSNLNYALERFHFNFFIVLSGRTLFYKDLNKTKIQIVHRRRIGPPPIDEWHWNTFKTTKLARHYFSKGHTLHSSAHEGLVFVWPVCLAVARFLNQHKDIQEELNNFAWCVEEFALQTIAVNESFGFSYIGNGVGEEYDPLAVNLFTRKI
jgi:hypothetical protein